MNCETVEDNTGQRVPDIKADKLFGKDLIKVCPADVQDLQAACQFGKAVREASNTSAMSQVQQLQAAQVAKAGGQSLEFRTKTDVQML